MNATVNSKELSTQLKKLSSIVRKNNIIPITSGVLFSFYKNGLSITGTDLETTYIINMDCVCEKDFSFCIDYFDISKISSVVNDDISISRVDNNIHIKSKKSTFKISVIGEVNEFPVTEDGDYDNKFIVDGDFFYHLQKANSCRLIGDGNPNLDKVAIRFIRNSFYVAGCDAAILYKKGFEQKFDSDFSITISNNFVSLCKTFQETDISISEKFIKATYNNDVIISRLSENVYPNIESILPDDFKSNISVLKEDLVNTINAVMTSVDQLSKSINIIFDKKGLTLQSKDENYNKEAESFLETKHSVEIDGIFFNAIQLSHIVSLIDSDYIDIQVLSATKSVYLKPSNDNTVFCLIQPLFNN